MFGKLLFSAKKHAKRPRDAPKERGDAESASAGGGWKPSWVCGAATQGLLRCTEASAVDEATESQLRAADGLPSFITESEEGWIKILNADQIKEFKDQPAELILRLESYFPEK